MFVCVWNVTACTNVYVMCLVHKPVNVKTKYWFRKLRRTFFSHFIVHLRILAFYLYDDKKCRLSFAWSYRRAIKTKWVFIILFMQHTHTDTLRNTAIGTIWFVWIYSCLNRFCVDVRFFWLDWALILISRLEMKRASKHAIMTWLACEQTTTHAFSFYFNGLLTSETGNSFTFMMQCSVCIHVESVAWWCN